MQNVRSLPPAGRWTKANSASAMADVVCNNRGDAVGTVGGTCAGVLHSVSAGAGTSDIDNAMGKAAAEVHKNNRQARCPSSKDALFWSTGVTRVIHTGIVRWPLCTNRQCGRALNKVQL